MYYFPCLNKNSCIHTYSLVKSHKTIYIYIILLYFSAGSVTRYIVRLQYTRYILFSDRVAIYTFFRQEYYLLISCRIIVSLDTSKITTGLTLTFRWKDQYSDTASTFVKAQLICIFISNLI